MTSIEFKASFGDGVDREVTISQVSGNLGGIHIYIDRYYAGSISNASDKWIFHMNEDTEKGKLRLDFPSWFGTADQDAILDRMIEAGWII